MGRSATKDATKSWRWYLSGLNGNIPGLAKPDVMLEGTKVFRIA
jgi:hypothetical protein